MADYVELDYEAFCEADLTDVGLDAYSRHESAEVDLAAYRLNGGELLQWDRYEGAAFPYELRCALEDPTVTKFAFNAQYERVMTNRVLKIVSPMKNWRCVQVMAYLQCFSGGLEDIGEQMELPPDVLKHAAEGRRLMRLFAWPQKPTKADPTTRHTPDTRPDDWQAYREYNRQDVIAEAAVYSRLRMFPPPDDEWELYEIDQVINQRGQPINRRYVQNAIAMGARRKAELTEQMRAICGLANPGSRTQLLPWLQARGYRFNDLQKGTVQKVLTEAEVLRKAGREPEITAECEKILNLRVWQSRISITKFDAMLKAAGPDDRLRFLFQFAGASRTARWAGRIVQTQNLASPPTWLEDPKMARFAVEAINTGDYETLQLMTQEPMEVLVAGVRWAFQTPPDEEYVVADLSSIESAVIAWLTGCKWLLEIFREGKDPYKTFGMTWFKTPYDEITKKQRKFCKPPVLGCGYRLGGGNLFDGKKTGLWGYAENMGVDMTQKESADAVKVFRGLCPEVVDHWGMYEEASMRAIRTGNVVKVGPLSFEYRKPYLLVRLPSGRCIHYFRPRIENRKVNTGRIVQRRAPRDMDANDCYFRFGVEPGELYETEETYEKATVTYMGMSQKSHIWTRMDTHGGRTIEQATQATARDVLKVNGILRPHRRGVRLVGHVHDEPITLRKIGKSGYGLDELEADLKTPIAWAPGLPLGAGGWVGNFYRKD